ncbi:MAG: hypothetical protein ABII74_09725 [Elusimicrobiota bacterium]
MAMVLRISGLISGFAVGYYYVHFTLKDKTKIIRNGTIYGGIAGLAFWHIGLDSGNSNFNSKDVFR